MVRKLGIIVACGLVVVTSSATVSFAAGDPKICAPAWLEGCQQRCIKSGGQLRYCPSYCAKEQRARGKC